MSRKGPPTLHPRDLGCWNLQSDASAFQSLCPARRRREELTHIKRNSHVACKTTAKLNADSGRKFLWRRPSARFPRGKTKAGPSVSFAYYEFLSLAHTMHVLLIILGVTPATRVGFAQAIIVVDAVEVVSAPDLAQRGIDWGFSVSNGMAIGGDGRHVQPRAMRCDDVK